MAGKTAMLGNDGDPDEHTYSMTNHQSQGVLLAGLQHTMFEWYLTFISVACKIHSLQALNACLRHSRINKT